MSELLERAPSEVLLEALNYQQELFVLTWFSNGFNGTQAAIEAQYAAPRQAACRLLTHPGIVAYVEARRSEERAARDLALREKHLTPDKIVADLAEMAGFDLGELLDEGGRIDRTKIKAKAKQLQAVEIDGAKTKIKGPDRLAAYRLLMDALGMLKKDQTNVQVNVGFAERMAARRAKTLED